MLERRLVSRVLSGDANAARGFVVRHYGPVLRWLRFLSGSEDAAGELAQRTFVLAHKGLPAFRFESSVRTWLRKIAYREFLRWRKEQRQLEVVETPEGSCEFSEDAIVLADAIAALPQGAREAFVLREVERLSVREAAEVLGVPEGTVKSRCHEARCALRRRLASTYGQNTSDPCEAENGS